MNLLHIDCSILGDASVSRLLSKKIVEKCRAEVPGLTVNYLDLAKDPVPHVTGEYCMALAGAPVPRSAELESELARGDALLSEFIAADVYVIGLPMYNWTVPSSFKAWFDRILRGDFTGARTEDPVLHGFSHYRLLIQPLRITGASLRDAVGDNADLRWASRAELSAIGLPAPVRRLLERTSPEKE